jgi:hypothetical protein
MLTPFMAQVVLWQLKKLRVRVDVARHKLETKTSA